MYNTCGAAFVHFLTRAVDNLQHQNDERLLPTSDGHRVPAYGVQRNPAVARPARSDYRCPPSADAPAERTAHQPGDCPPDPTAQADREPTAERVPHAVQAEVFAPMPGSGSEAGAGELTGTATL